MSDETSAPTPDASFQAMAERIVLNAGQSFGGAYVIVPPVVGSVTLPPIEVLVLDTQQDAAQFFMLLSTKIKSALDLIEIEERKRGGYGR